MFLRRLSATRATVASIFASFFEMFDVPVYWPILVVYFFVLFLLTMRRQVQCVAPFSLVPSPLPCVRDMFSAPSPDTLAIGWERRGEGRDGDSIQSSR